VCDQKKNQTNLQKTKNKHTNNPTTTQKKKLPPHYTTHQKNIHHT